MPSNPDRSPVPTGGCQFGAVGYALYAMPANYQTRSRQRRGTVRAVKRGRAGTP